METLDRELIRASLDCYREGNVEAPRALLVRVLSSIPVEAESFACDLANHAQFMTTLDAYWIKESIDQCVKLMSTHRVSLLSPGISPKVAFLKKPPNYRPTAKDFDELMKKNDCSISYDAIKSQGLII